MDTSPPMWPKQASPVRGQTVTCLCGDTLKRYFIAFVISLSPNFIILIQLWRNITQFKLKDILWNNWLQSSKVSRSRKFGFNWWSATQNETWDLITKLNVSANQILNQEQNSYKGHYRMTSETKFEYGVQNR